MPTLAEQLQADRITLATMLADQRAYTTQLTDHADPLELKGLRLQTAGQHGTYLVALEHALEVLDSLLTEPASVP